jgi:hypothetical protein
MQALNSKVPWMLSTALFFCTTLAMLASRTFLGNHGTFESGFSTDFSKFYHSQSFIFIKLTQPEQQK